MVKKETFKHSNRKKILKYIEKNIPFKKHSLVQKGFSSYNSVFDYTKCDGIFLPYIHKFCSMAGKDYRILDFWINIVEPGGYTKPHNHITEFEELKQIPQKTGVFYLQKPRHSGNLYIENNLIKVKNNDILIFDPSLNHHTEINKSNNQRIIFSVNMAEKVTKDYIDGKFYFVKEL